MNELERLRFFVNRMLEDFPGLLEGEKEVNGADLVEWITKNVADILLCSEPLSGETL